MFKSCISAIPLIGLAIGAIVFGSNASASTGFHLSREQTGDDQRAYAISTGWNYPTKAAIVVNKRDLRKVAELFGGPGQPARWVSEYGSVTFTINGREFPISGINERGLVIQATVLRDRQYPKPPPLSQSVQAMQWIQYQLDTAATVAEVIESSIVSTRPVLPWSRVPLHYQVCDAKDCAVISFFDRTALAHSTFGFFYLETTTGIRRTDPRFRMPFTATANDTYLEHLEAYQKCGRRTCPDLDDSLQRFNTVANAMSTYRNRSPGRVDAMLQFLFGALAHVDQDRPLTTWNAAYHWQGEPGSDDEKVTLFFKDPKKPARYLQWIDLDFKKLNFDCRRSSLMWWVEIGKAGGNRTKSAQAFTRKTQERLALQHSEENGGTTPKEILDLFIRYPETKTGCQTAEERR